MKRIIRATAVALALGSTVMVSGCGSLNEAATVNGTMITETEVNSAVQQINEGLKLTQPVTPVTVLNMLIAAPTILDYAAEQGVDVTESQVRASVAITDPSPSTLKVIRLNEVLTGMTGAQQVEASARLAELQVTVNPKYGAYDAAKVGVAPAQPDWLTTPAG